jgi:hypothetical protein
MVIVVPRASRLMQTFGTTTTEVPGCLSNAKEANAIG